MIAVFSQPDAVILAALAAAVPATIAAISSVRNGRAMKPNGGSSPLDAINRIERKVDGLYEKHAEHAARLDQLEEYVTNPPAVGHIRKRKETT